MPLLRSIVHMDLDTFFVSCERLLDSRLNHKPILIGGTSDRGVVASCSYEARKFGIHSAMPMRMAKQRCPEAIVIKGNSSTYTKYSRLVTDIIKESSPLYEKSSIDEFYIDFTGMDRFHGVLKYSTELRQRILKETGLPISFGLSENKTVSKIATGEAKPDNQIQISYGNEKNFLSPLSVRKIPMVGLKTYQSLCNLGVRTIKPIQEMPIEMMERIMGRNGVGIWKKANGIDLTPVVQHNERKSISTERTFNQDTTDVVKLKGILSAMAENLAYQLRRGDKLSGCVTVKVRYSDFQTQTIQKKIPYTAADHELIPMVLELFERAFSRRLLVRLIGVRYSSLVSGNYQLGLFGDTIDYPSLYNALDRIRLKYGDRSVIKAIGMEAKTIGGWNPFNGEPPALLANRRS
ncbi:MAG: DNA polymerase IV [Crocinitomicaceae bacterium]|nr:DNA polymerase IV [Crocinitomicaceae bacterium]